MKERLAIFGGNPLRKTPFPSRNLFDASTKKSVNNFLTYYSQLNEDFSSNGYFEKLYTSKFVNLMGGTGYCHGVSSGTAALFVSIAALSLPENSTILVSPITDPGSISSIILNKCKPKMVDTLQNSYQLSLESIISRYSTDVKALMVVHAAGKAVPDIDKIQDFCKDKKIYLIEDCSQSHGASFKGTQIGNFGDIAAYSTMYSKNHSSGGTGGIIYTKSADLYNLSRMYSDRGKPFHYSSFNPKDPSIIEFPALNLPLNEFCSAIGHQTLLKLDKIRQKRISLLKTLHAKLFRQSSLCKITPITDEDSPYFWPIYVNTDDMSCNKIQFAQALIAEGASINPDYKYLVHTWPWVQKYLTDSYQPLNAVKTINSSFNLLFNENFSTADINDIGDIISKVEKYY